MSFVFVYRTYKNRGNFTHKATSLMNIIGIKHDFLCINICWARTEIGVENQSSLELQLLPRGSANDCALESHVWSLLLHKNMVQCRKTWKLKEICILCGYKYTKKGTFTVFILKTLHPGQKSMSFWRHVFTCLLLLLTSLFVVAPECLQLK